MSVQIHINGENAAEAVKELSALASHLGSDQPSATQVVTQPSTQQSTWTPDVNAQTTSVATVPNYQATQPQQQQWPAQTQQTVPVQQPQNQGFSGQQGYQPPVQQQQPTGAVPTTAPTYSLDQLGVAAGPLVDAGRGQELTAWLNQHGAQALTQLDPAKYGEFATYLRSLGARL